MYIPEQMNCVSSFDIVRKSLCPPLSMNVIPLRSTVHARPFCDRCLFFQHVLNSPTHGPTKRPSSVHLCSVGVSATVIRNISFTPIFHPAMMILRTSAGLASAANSRNISALALMRAIPSALAHMYFRPTSFKMHIVHKRFHQQDAAPMLGGVRCEAVTHRVPEVESFSLIGHDERYFTARQAAA